MSRNVRAIACLVLAALIGACDTAPESENPVAVFQVEDEQFRVELATAELVEQAEGYLGQQIIPIGTVVRDDPGVNEPWSWHIDPATLEFTEVTIEVCDGLPSFVEDGTVTSDQYCPWGAVLVDIEGLADS